MVIAYIIPFLGSDEDPSRREKNGWFTPTAVAGVPVGGNNLMI